MLLRLDFYCMFTKSERGISKASEISNNEYNVGLTLPFSIFSIACLSLLQALAKSDWLKPFCVRSLIILSPIFFCSCSFFTHVMCENKVKILSYFKLTIELNFCMLFLAAYRYSICEQEF